MNNTTRVIIVALVVAAAAAAFYLKDGGDASNLEAVPLEEAGGSRNATPATTTSADLAALEGKPRLVCLGAERCVPCRMMVPVREALAESYPDTLGIQFVDVWQDRAAGQRYGIRMIPTTIFMDADGEEQYRQEGFMDKDTIVAKFEELGIALDGSAS